MGHVIHLVSRDRDVLEGVIAAAHAGGIGTPVGEPRDIDNDEERWTQGIITSLAVGDLKKWCKKVSQGRVVVVT